VVDAAYAHIFRELLTYMMEKPAQHLSGQPALQSIAKVPDAWAIMH